MKETPESNHLPDEESRHLSWRERLYHIIEYAHLSTASRIYNGFMSLVVFASLLPLCFKENPPAVTVLEWVIFEWVIFGIFVIDYILRWMTADMRDRHYDGVKAILRYPITFWAILDLISIVSFVIPADQALRLIRLIRVFEPLRYTRSFCILIDALYRERFSLAAVGFLVMLYIVAIAIVMFNCEPDLFDTMLDALYWSATSLATIGYGDFAPESELGRAINIVSAFVGIAVVAIPTGIITSAYVATLNEVREKYHIYANEVSFIDYLAKRRAHELGKEMDDVTSEDIFGKSRYAKRQERRQERRRARRQR